MNLFARILSHGFALVVVALLALGLIYRGELFPEWELPGFLALGQKPDAEATVQGSATAEEPVPAPVAAEPARSPTAEAEVAADESAPQTAPLPSESVEEAGQETTAAAAVPSDVEDQGASGPTGALTADLAAGAGAGVEPAGQTAEAAVPGADETPAVTPEPAEPATDLTAAPEAAADAGTAGAAAPAATVAAEAPAAEAAAVTAAGAGQERAEPAATTPYRVLAAAREAYWLRDYAAAEQKYQELIALDPDNPDGYGELGNMYFSQGDWEKASAAYYEAGTRLATEGLYDRARQLVEVIRGLNGGQADDLEQQINAAESAAP